MPACLQYLCPHCYTTTHTTLPEDGDAQFWNLPCLRCGRAAVQIDSALLPTIERLWRLAVPTDFCCAGHPDNQDWGAYLVIRFPQPKDARRFRRWVLMRQHARMARDIVVNPVEWTGHLPWRRRPYWRFAVRCTHSPRGVSAFHHFLTTLAQDLEALRAAGLALPHLA